MRLYPIDQREQARHSELVSRSGSMRTSSSGSRPLLAPSNHPPSNHPPSNHPSIHPSASPADIPRPPRPLLLVIMSGDDLDTPRPSRFSKDTLIPAALFLASVALLIVSFSLLCCGTWFWVLQSLGWVCLIIFVLIAYRRVHRQAEVVIVGTSPTIYYQVRSAYTLSHACHAPTDQIRRRVCMPACVRACAYVQPQPSYVVARPQPESRPQSVFVQPHYQSSSTVTGFQQPKYI